MTCALEEPASTLPEDDEASVALPLEHAEAPKMATAARPAAAAALRWAEFMTW